MLLVLLAAVALQAEAVPDASVGCAAPPAARPGFGYRDGLCSGCECCPLRWSCLEMHSQGYNCAERTGVDVEELELTQRSPTWTVGATIAASVSGVRWAAIPACHSVLPPGLSLALNGPELSLSGELGYDPTRPSMYSFEFEATSVVGDSYSEVFALQRVKLTAQVLNTKPTDLPAGAARAIAATEVEARSAGISGFDAFDHYYNQRTLSHPDSVARMYVAEQGLTKALNEEPALSAGLFWGWAGDRCIKIDDFLCSNRCVLYYNRRILYIK